MRVYGLEFVSAAERCIFYLVYGAHRDINYHRARCKKCPDAPGRVSPSFFRFHFGGYAWLCVWLARTVLQLSPRPPHGLLARVGGRGQRNWFVTPSAQISPASSLKHCALLR